MIPHRGLLPILTALLLFSSLTFATAQQDEDRQYFEKTGHWVSGEFLAFYSSVDDPERLFGSPITDSFADPLRQGITIQYFERVRMDLDPTQPAGERVSLANLGLWMYDDAQRGLLVDFPDNNAMCRVFANAKKVCYAFLQLYDRYNGAVLFGQPVSNLEYANDHLVQYFENVRMEWRTEMPENQKVVLTEIGRIDFDHRIGDDNKQRPNRITQYQRELRIQAFVAYPLVGPNDRQVVHVVAHDQFHNPWADVQMVITLEYPDGRTESRKLENLTGGDGLAAGEFELDNIEPNQIIQVAVEAIVVNGPTASATTWFRGWW